MARIFEGDPKDRLLVEEVGPGFVRVMYEPSPGKLEESERFSTVKAGSTIRRRLLEIETQKNHFRIYPLNTFPTDEDFLRPKYNRIESIILEGFDFHLPTSMDEVRESLEELPSGFIKDFEYGLGFQKDYRSIIGVIEEVPEIKHLIISKDRATEISGESYTIAFKEYDALRRGINRITKNQQHNAAVDKVILTHNSLLTVLDNKRFPERTRPYKKGTIFKLISTDREVKSRLSAADQSAAVHLIDQNRRELAEKTPELLARLRNDIELVTLEVLIGKYEDMLTRDLSESRWQSLFGENPFILNLAFGYPVIKIRDQAHVGGQTLSGAGDTIADFLVRNRISNNAAIFEIKMPRTSLLNRTPYREGLYTPSSDLSGAINQMLDQKREFQQNIATIKENSRIYDLETYALHGVLVIGTTPEGRDEQKSFELFRGNSKDVTIITFDELLAKLKLLQAFLVSHAPGAAQAVALEQLGVRLLRAEDGLNGLFDYEESNSGSFFAATSKPRPGVDGNSVRALLGELTLLKRGFERARMQAPPYPVRFEKSDQRIVAVRTLDELIGESEKVISGAEAVLAAESKKK